ncbi:MAG TPA: hypothetical protein VIO15_09460, partial [Bacteroidales bacterium]
LNAITIEEAIASFSLIDDKIIDLLQCSSDDFLTLNDHFKVYHKESKNLSGNANEIIEALTDRNLICSFSELKKIADNFNQISNTFASNIENFDIELKKIKNKVESIVIIQQSYKQNILSVNVLLANVDKNESLNIGAFDKKIVSFSNLIKEDFLQTEKLISEFALLASEGNNFLDKVKKETYSTLLILNDQIDSSLKLFNKKNQEASQLIDFFKGLNEKNSGKIANIITNLQYHDIIRQKIEHIQNTHKDIIKELKSIQNNESEVIQLHNKVKIYIKIRDVAGLQAAQLIHANNQYQAAINQISENLETLGNEMITISSTCNNFVSRSEHAKDVYLNTIVELLNNALKYIRQMNQQLDAIKDKIATLKQRKGEIDAVMQNIHQQKVNIEVELKNININNKYLSQASEVLKETDDLFKKYSTLSKELNQKLGLSENISILGQDKLVEAFGQMNNSLPLMIDLLKKSAQTVEEYLSVNTNISLNVSESIKKSLHNIKYYELFEKSSEVIIQELNTLNARLNSGSGELNKISKEENLKLLKSRYTMASEHYIHDQISNLENGKLTEGDMEEIVKQANEKNEEDDDNLELF